MTELISTRLIVGNDEVFIEGYVVYNIDRHYGEDADGNRGEARIIVTDVKDIVATDYDYNKVKLSKEDMDRAAEKLTIKFLES